MIKLGILTSSRADFGIYEPLLRSLSKEQRINTKLIVFGTHLSSKYGNSIQAIEKIGTPIIARLDTAPEDDSPNAVSLSMAKTMMQVADVWEHNTFDLLLALGDRYEMFAAVASAVPYNIKIGHIHGGETTTGAIDNALRHSISHMSSLHFTATEIYRQKVIQLVGNEIGVYNTGALSIDSLSNVNFMSKKEIELQYGINMEIPSMLITLHPETIGFNKNIEYAEEMIVALEEYSHLNQIITMPNADTCGLIIRKKLIQYADNHPNVKLIENFGARGYHSVMKHSVLVLGNSSSGFIEAAWFPKWVINIGNRQNGRLRTKNILDVPFDKIQIREAINIALSKQVPVIEPVYGDGKASEKIIKHIIDEFSNN